MMREHKRKQARDTHNIFIRSHAEPYYSEHLVKKLVLLVLLLRFLNPGVLQHLLKCIIDACHINSPEIQ